MTIRDLILEQMIDLDGYWRRTGKADHRTGCSPVLDIILDILIDDWGWDERTAVDALVLEAVRAGGNRERKARK